MNFDNNDIQRNDENALPPIGDTIPADAPSTEAVAAPVLTDAPVKKKKRKGWLLALLITASVLLLLAIIAAALLLPLFPRDPVANTAGTLFYDRQTLAALQRNHAKGSDISLQLTLPADKDQELLSPLSLSLDIKSDQKAGHGTLTLASGEESLTLTLTLDEKRVSVQGLTDEPILFSREQIEQQLEDSVLHPDSGTVYALTQNQYDELKRTLLSLEGEETDTLPASVRSIYDSFEENAEKSTDIGFDRQRFALTRTVTYTLEGAALQRVIQAVVLACREDESLDRLLLPLIATDLDIALERSAAEILDRQISSWKDAKVTLRYCISGGKVTSFELLCEDAVVDKGTDVFELVFTLVQSKEEQGFDLTVREGSRGEDSKIETDHTTYRIQRGKSTTDITIVNTVSTALETDEDTVETITLHHDKESGFFRIHIPESDELFAKSSEITGTLLLDKKAGTVNFSIDTITVNDEPITSATALSLQLVPHDKSNEIPAPLENGAELLKLDDTALNTLFRTIPAKQLDAVLTSYLGPVSLFAYTLDDKPLLHAERCAEHGDKLLTAYRNYLADARDKKETPAYTVYVFDDALDAYFLLIHNPDNNSVYYLISYELDPITQMTYYPAVLSGTVLIVDTLTPTGTELIYNWYERIASPKAAIDFAQQDNVSLLTTEPVYLVCCDYEQNLIVVGNYASDRTNFWVYRADTLALYRQFSIMDAIVALDAADGKIVLASSSRKLYLYDTATTLLGSAYLQSGMERIRSVYLSGNTAIILGVGNTGTVTRYSFVEGEEYFVCSDDIKGVVVDASSGRLYVWANDSDDGYIRIYDLDTWQLVGWRGDLPDATGISYHGNYFALPNGYYCDLDGKLMLRAPESELMTIEFDDARKGVLATLYGDSGMQVVIYLDLLSSCGIAVQRKGDEAPILLNYYATCAIPVKGGDLLLYTPSQQGLVLVDLP